MRLNSVVILSLLGLATASPMPADSSSAVDAEFQFDRDILEADYKLALEKIEADPHLAKRLNTQSSSNVAFGQAIYAAGEATYKQVKAISNWNKAREQFVKGVTQIMMDHNPDPKTAVAAICYNKKYGIKDPKNIYGLRSEDLSIWPAKTDYDCFYMGRGNAFWSQGDGGSINLWTRWQGGACRFDKSSDLYC
ncbi:hypothetical protein FSARC_10731 [Fusarium sarcochroum]|uniref:DUF7888 domain-containing protein n=1 Tax=Fusarium sarcochroum TaxID=1208366 RepID=A0A8H4TK69_9HYPO|nr:hypothetical protein FSARC_10731 [Fusarium sarcochroum]